MAYTPSKDELGKGSFMKSPYWPKLEKRKKGAEIDKINEKNTVLKRIQCLL